MRKLFVVAIVLLFPIFISTGAWAAVGDLFVNDVEGVPGAYYGGLYTTPGPVHDPTYAHDITPNTPLGQDNWSVVSMEANSSIPGYIKVILKGPYFGSINVDPSNALMGKPGDLYISSTGWKVTTDIGGTGYGVGDKFLLSEGWDYVVPFKNNAAGFNTGLYELTGPFTSSSNQGIFTEWREDQAWRDGAGNKVGNAKVDLFFDPTGSLTFTVENVFNWDPAGIGYHWTMGCGNDVVEGGAQVDVPEPAALLLLGLGLVGLAVYKRKGA